VDLVLVDKPRPHVSRITLNRPERLNPMNFGLVSDLYEALDLLRARPRRAAIDLEDRNQLMVGHTGNLEEARAAFREKRAPRYAE
jgi:1,4-dihydroxy-2-naphthoyl-CoA synthase